MLATWEPDERGGPAVGTGVAVAIRFGRVAEALDELRMGCEVALLWTRTKTNLYLKSWGCGADFVSNRAATAYHGMP